MPLPPGPVSYLNQDQTDSFLLCPRMTCSLLSLQEGDHRWINTVARALQLLSSLYGPFAKTYGIGRCAKVLPALAQMSSLYPQLTGVCQGQVLSPAALRSLTGAHGKGKELPGFSPHAGILERGRADYLAPPWEALVASQCSDTFAGAQAASCRVGGAWTALAPALLGLL